MCLTQRRKARQGIRACAPLAEKVPIHAGRDLLTSTEFAETDFPLHFGDFALGLLDGVSACADRIDR
jgi:hypothetical protein